jgi:hypothetical protein
MKIRTSNFMKDKSIFFNMRVLPLTICSLLSISLLLIYFYNLPFSPSSKNEFTHSKPIINITSHSSLSVSPTLSSYSGMCIYIISFVKIIQLLEDFVFNFNRVNHL